MSKSTKFLGHKIISDQITATELAVLTKELARVLDNNIEGDIVELGCYMGTSALFEARMIYERAPSKKLWLYDSFQGLPEKLTQDLSPSGEQFKVGELRTNKEQLIRNFKQAGLNLPNIKKAWFSDLQSNDLPKHICFAFLDGDYYQSIIDSFRLVWPKLLPGSVVIVDDYNNEALPGAAKAVDEWLDKHSAKLRVQASLAIIQV